MGIILLLYAVLQSSPGGVAAFLNSVTGLPPMDRPAAVEAFFKLHPTTPVIEGDTRVWFFYFGRAQEVFIIGDFQKAWMEPEPLKKIACGDQSLFYARYVVPRDARLDYKLIVDGKEITDSRNPRITPSGFGAHSEVRMPGFVSTPYLTPDPMAATGRMDTLSFRSRKSSIRPRDIFVYVPSGYDSTQDWFPSVYVHDGRDAIDFAFYPVVADNLTARGLIRPLIFVFIPPVERTEEYLTGGHVQYGNVICDEIVPMIDAQYRTSIRPEDRLMMGISNGGHLSLRTVLNRPDVFLNTAGQSSTPSPALLRGIQQIISVDSPRTPFRLYLDVGVYDLVTEAEQSFLEGNRRIHALLTERGHPHVYHEFHDGHQWANWRERTPEILMYFFPPIR